MFKFCEHLTAAAWLILQVDGVNNAKIQSLHIENYPIYCARFSQDGTQVILGSRHKAFYYYDMIQGQLHNVQPIKGENNIRGDKTHQNVNLFSDYEVVCVNQLPRRKLFNH